MTTVVCALEFPWIWLGVKIADLSLWWYGKMLTLLSLLGFSVYEAFSGDWISAPTLYIAQALVAFGALFNLWHFLLLKRRAKNLGSPEVLVTCGGMLCRIRRAM